MSHFLTQLLGDNAASLVLRHARSGALVASRVEGAFDSDSRRRGLLGRDALASDKALIIAPCQAVHTFGMRFPIDILFTTRDGTIVKVREHVRPGRISGAWSAFAVIELAAGTAARAAVRPGDRLELTRRHSIGADA
jgi:uncharacterized membrane protein (UPF0127 family)